MNKGVFGDDVKSFNQILFMIIVVRYGLLGKKMSGHMM